MFFVVAFRWGLAVSCRSFGGLQGGQRLSRGKPKLLRNRGIGCLLAVEAQLLHQLVDLLPGHVTQGDSLQLLVSVVEEYKLRVGARQVLHLQVMVEGDVLGDEGFHLPQPVQPSPAARLRGEKTQSEFQAFGSY